MSGPIPRATRPSRRAAHVPDPDGAARDGRPAPIPGAAALALDGATRSSRTIVVSDVHLGLPEGDRRSDRPTAVQAERMALDLIGLGESAAAGGIVIAGDAKHPIVGVPRPLRPVVFDFFATLLSAGREVSLVLGNHDVGIERSLPREVEVVPAGGLRRGDVGIFHGHRWPSDDVLAARRLVVGHLHPGYRLAPTADNPSGKARCWVRVRYPSAPPAPAGPSRTFAAEELVVLPAFHPLAGAEALNVDRPRRSRSFLVGRFVAPGAARAYLLDGTDLGPTLRPRPDRPSEAAPEGAPGP